MRLFCHRRLVNIIYDYTCYWLNSSKSSLSLKKWKTIRMATTINPSNASKLIQYKSLFCRAFCMFIRAKPVDFQFTSKFCHLWISTQSGRLHARQLQRKRRTKDCEKARPLAKFRLNLCLHFFGVLLFLAEHVLNQ